MALDSLLEMSSLLQSGAERKEPMKESERLREGVFVGANGREFQRSND